MILPRFEEADLHWGDTWLVLLNEIWYTVPSTQVKCECEEDGMPYNRHWSEDKYGNEIRIFCGCNCPVCEEY